MRCMQLSGAKSGSALIAAEIPQPRPGKGDLLIHVRAAGVTPTELQWSPSTHTREGATRTAAVPGHEFSGVVAAIGEGATGFDVGEEIYGLNDWFANGRRPSSAWRSRTKSHAIPPLSLTRRRPRSPLPR